MTLLRAPSEPIAWPYRMIVVDDDLGGPYPAPSRAPFTDALRRLGVELSEEGSDGAGPPDGSKLVAVFADVRAWKGRVGLSAGARTRIREALAEPGPGLVVLFSHPWNAVEIPTQAALLCAWGGEPLMQEAAARSVARLAGG